MLLFPPTLDHFSVSSRAVFGPRSRYFLDQGVGTFWTKGSAIFFKKVETGSRSRNEHDISHQGLRREASF